MTPIATNTFRFCLECDEKIPLKRLQAVPHANYCVRCQTQYDRRPKVSIDAAVVMAETDVRALEGFEFKRNSKIREMVRPEVPARLDRVEVA